MSRRPRRPAHNKAFSSAGTRNRGSSGLFGHYAADDQIITKKKAPKRDKNRPHSSRKPEEDEPTCDRNGAPTMAHRGQTSLRHKSMRAGWVGTSVPHGNRKLDYTKEFGWMPDRYQNPEISTFREHGEKIERRRLTTDGFKNANKPQPELFDPHPRIMAANHTAAPDRKLLEWVTPGRVSHERPFAHASAPREKREDRGFIGSHRHFAHGYQPYEEYEHQHQLTQKGQETMGYGHRPDHYTSSMGTPWKTTVNQRRYSPRNITSMTAFHDQNENRIEAGRNMGM